MRLLLVDGHAYAYRAFYAIRQLSSPSGRPTNAIYGFVKMLGKLLENLKPTHCAVIWDGGLAPERLAALPEYKAQRPPMPDALEEQLDGIVEYLHGAAIASFCRDGIEADDWIATLACAAAADGFEVVVASSDKDFMQLVSPRIGLINPNDKTEAIWKADQVVNKTGVQPEQIVDWLCLVGDSVDNIPGAPGIGAKTAAQLLREFGSLEQVFSHLERVTSERVAGSLRESQELLRRNQGLIRLRRDLPVERSWDDLRVGSPNLEHLRELYAGWGFKTLSKELEARHAAEPVLL
ncbi:MAG: 5'-3' exonuclease H3TH domain-containing protein [Verrucomicrobiota bacterium]